MAAVTISSIMGDFAKNEDWEGRIITILNARMENAFQKLGIAVSVADYATAEQAELFLTDSDMRRRMVTFFESAPDGSVIGPVRMTKITAKQSHNPVYAFVDVPENELQEMGACGEMGDTPLSGARASGKKGEDKIPF